MPAYELRVSRRELYNIDATKAVATAASNCAAYA